MNRRDWLGRSLGTLAGSVGLVSLVGLAGSIGLVAPASKAVAAPKKARKKGIDQKKSDGNVDGLDTVDGALWVLSAREVKSGKEVTFRYRAKSGVLYDPQTDRPIGVTEGTKKRQAHVTFRPESLFPGSFDITRIRLNHWRGQKADASGSWKISLDCVDR
jgi:hypothetical protein